MSKEHRHCWGINLKCLECDEYYPSYEGQQQRILAQKDRRIAELEAEVARLKDMHKAKWIEAYSRICPDITEEGEG